MTLCNFPTGGRDGVQLSLLQPSAPSEHRKPLELREYQKQMRSDVYRLIKAGTKRILCYAPTGSGKTLVLCSIAKDALGKGRRVEVAVHRDFLIEQTITALVSVGVERESIGIIKAGYLENLDRPLQLVSIQTLQSRLQKREMPKGFDLVIVDECHTTAFHEVHKQMKAASPDAIHLGFTASPWRLKPQTEYFGLHYDAIVRGPSIKWLMKNGFLSSVRYFGWGGIADISKLETNSEGDFKREQMENLFIDSDVPQHVVERVTAMCSTRTGIVFNSGVAQSRLQTQLLNAAGILTSHVDAKTPIDERRRIYGQLERGEIRCISSVGCLTEGFDIKSIGFIVLARATKSRALYVQVCGRGLRACEGKENCLILDFGGNVKRLGYLTSSWPIKLEPAPKEDAPAMTKECPQCGCLCHVFVRICPDCGFEFTGDKEIEDNGPEQFGELLDPETLALTRYIRSQRKMRYSKNLPPDQLWEKFKEKYGKEAILPNFRLKGAIFAGKSTRANYQRMLDYLEGQWLGDWTLKTMRWMSHHLSIEFGLPPGDTVSCESCWQLLEIDDVTPPAEIKAAYREALRGIDPQDADQIDLLNWALDKALRLTTP